MVLTPLPLNFSTSRMEYPLRSKLITSLYSAFICSAVFTEPTLRPSFPPFSIYRFLPDCNRNEILSRSNCAQLESVAIIIGAKRDGCSSSSNLHHFLLKPKLEHAVGNEDAVLLQGNQFLVDEGFLDAVDIGFAAQRIGFSYSLGGET